jgi:F-type H+-transporting ATPase subunit b
MQINLFPDRSLFAVMATYVVNYIVVSKCMVGPINRVLEEREHDAKTATDRYEQSLASFNESTAQIEERLHLTKREAAKMRDDFRTDAATHRAGIIERTTNEAKRLVAEAEAHLTKDVATARERIVRDSESLARLAAERILGRAL